MTDTNITIPPAALEAAAQEMAPHPWSMYTEAAKDHFRHKARAALLAGLNAWPGMQNDLFGSWVLDGNDLPRAEEYYAIILPLPQEASDE